MFHRPSGRTPTRFLWVLASVALALAAVMAIAAGAPAQSGATPRLEATPDPACADVVDTGGGDCANPGPVVLTSDEQTILDKKNALVSEYADLLAGTLSMAVYQHDLQSFIDQYGGPTTAAPVGVDPDTTCPSTAMAPTTAYTAKAVSMTQQRQTTTYYCGPATASEVLRTRGVSVSQSTLASNTYLHVIHDPNNRKTWGTSWNPYVMGPTLNTLTNSSWYSAVNGTGVRGGFTSATWQADLGFDIDNGWAIAGNIVEYAGGAHLVGHPGDKTIYHWIGIYGYSSSGASTRYADSVHGDTGFWPWAANVPAYSTISSSTMTTLLNRRGFVW
jgi:uncharacterized membrane protein